jgi:hypothetical protein
MYWWTHSLTADSDNDLWCAFGLRRRVAVSSLRTFVALFSVSRTDTDNKRISVSVAASLITISWLCCWRTLREHAGGKATERWHGRCAGL